MVLNKRKIGTTWAETRKKLRKPNQSILSYHSPTVVNQEKPYVSKGMKVSQKYKEEKGNKMKKMDPKNSIFFLEPLL